MLCLICEQKLKGETAMSDALGPEGSYYEAKRREEERKRREQSDAVYPIKIVALYLALGFFFGLWHPGWLLFLTIPLHYIHFTTMRARFTNPITITLLYLVLGFFFGLWHPGWMVFLIIPAAGACGWYEGMK